jgi:hypothetical protein
MPCSCPATQVHACPALTHANMHMVCALGYMQREPPTPEVDPENAEFVIFVKAKKVRSPMISRLSVLMRVSI